MTAELEWYKSSYSTEQGGNCLEIAPAPKAVHIRDSKRSPGPTLTVPRDSWAGFLVLARRS
ncbi:hypothetical protein SY2F82_44530 [Streptomyces sp. Y2F8-2]|uniref:DUF397 domain-containing protein n=1 Tax=Streptomyces sp. Y2F8-2 TaxID=2759675 RepID=UPI001905CB44|nr:DUF397 domain-containing protein [Streptomyces sp. Y2F8-2]GHK02656.1 hypothetical protein SY2F82_44530 [Streptomyces sp. Y2F8-2]